MNKRKFAHSLSLLCVLFAGLLVYLLSTTTVFYPGQIYDNNKLIAEEKDSYHTGVSTRSSFNEDGETEFLFEPFSGSQTAHIFEIASDGTLFCSWNIIVNKGQFKVVLVNTEKKEVIETICEGTGTGKNEINLPLGEYRIKFVGNNATADGQIKINILE